MLGLLIGSAIVGGVIGLGNGIASAKSQQAGFDDKLTELNHSVETLDSNYNQATASYELSKKQSIEAAKATTDEYSFLAEETLENRDTSLAQSATTGSMQSQVNAAQIATLEVENEKAVGTANSAAASSGFRGTGTSKNIVDNAKSSGADIIKQAKMQASLSNAQTYNQAVNNYTSANQQEAAYQRRIAETEDTLDRTLASLDLAQDQAEENYTREGGYLTSDIDYMNTEGKSALKSSKAWNIISGLFGGASSGLSFGKSITE